MGVQARDRHNAENVGRVGASISGQSSSRPTRAGSGSISGDLDNHFTAHGRKDARKSLALLRQRYQEEFAKLS